MADEINVLNNTDPVVELPQEQERINTQLIPPQSIKQRNLADASVGTAQLNEPLTLTAPVIDVGSDAQGDIYYRDSTGAFARLGAGTSGYFLKTQGTSADPVWAAATGVSATTAKARAYLNVQMDNLTNNTYTKVTLDAESYDPGNNFASNKFTVPTTGYYAVTGTVKYLTVNGATPYYAAIYKNGSIIAENVNSSTSIDDVNISVSVNDIVSLTAADYIELYAKQVGGTSDIDVAAGAAITYLSIHLIST